MHQCFARDSLFWRVSKFYHKDSPHHHHHGQSGVCHCPFPRPPPPSSPNFSELYYVLMTNDKLTNYDVMISSELETFRPINGSATKSHKLVGFLCHKKSKILLTELALICDPFYTYQELSLSSKLNFKKVFEEVLHTPPLTDGSCNSSIVHPGMFIETEVRTKDLVSSLWAALFEDFCKTTTWMFLVERHLP